MEDINQSEEDHLYTLWMPTSRENFFHPAGAFHDRPDNQPDNGKQIHERKDYLHEGAANRLMTFLLNPSANSPLREDIRESVKGKNLTDEEVTKKRIELLKRRQENPEFRVAENSKLRLYLHPNHLFFKTMSVLPTGKDLERADPLRSDQDTYKFYWPKNRAKCDFLAHFSQVFGNWSFEKRTGEGQPYRFHHRPETETKREATISVADSKQGIHDQSRKTSPEMPTSHLTVRLEHRMDRHRSEEELKRDNKLIEAILPSGKMDTMILTKEEGDPVPFDLTFDEYGFYYFDFSTYFSDPENRGKVNRKRNRARYIISKMFGGNFICHSMNPSHDYEGDTHAKTLIRDGDSTRGYQGILSHDQLLMVIEGLMNYNLNTKVFFEIGKNCGEEPLQVKKQYSFHRFIDDILISLPASGCRDDLIVPPIDYGNVELDSLYGRQYAIPFVKTIVEDNLAPEEGECAEKRPFRLPNLSSIQDELQEQKSVLEKGRRRDHASLHRIDSIVPPERGNPPAGEIPNERVYRFRDIFHVFIQDKIEELAMRRFIRAMLERPYLAEIERSVYVTRKRLTNRIIEETNLLNFDQISFESDDTPYFFSETNLANFCELLISKVPILKTVNVIMRDAYYIKLGNLTSVARVEEEEEIDQLSAYRTWLQKVNNIVDNTELLAVNLSIFTAARTRDVAEEALRAETNRWDQEKIQSGAGDNEDRFRLTESMQAILVFIGIIVALSPLLYGVVSSSFPLTDCSSGYKFLYRFSMALGSVAVTTLSAAVIVRGVFFEKIVEVCPQIAWMFRNQPVYKFLSDFLYPPNQLPDFSTFEYRRRSSFIGELPHRAENAMIDINSVVDLLERGYDRALDIQCKADSTLFEISKNSTRISRDKELLHVQMKILPDRKAQTGQQPFNAWRHLSEHHVTKAFEIIEKVNGKKHDDVKELEEVIVKNKDDIVEMILESDYFSEWKGEGSDAENRLFRCLKGLVGEILCPADPEKSTRELTLENFEKNVAKISLYGSLIFTFELRPVQQDKLQIFLDSAKIYYRIDDRKLTSDKKVSSDEKKRYCRIVEATLQLGIFLVLDTLFPKVKENE